MVKALHREGIEVILDVVYNHTAEGNQLGSHAQLSRHRQSHVLQAGARQPALLHGLHRHRQQLECAPSAGAQADHGQPALLGHGDARGRLPLRSGGNSGARAARCGPARGVLRHHSSGPDHFAGETDRGTLGRRRRRISGRQFPRAMGGVEREISRHGSPLLERRRRTAFRSGLSADRQQRSLPA